MLRRLGSDGSLHAEDFCAKVIYVLYLEIMEDTITFCSVSVEYNSMTYKSNSLRSHEDLAGTIGKSKIKRTVQH